MDNKNFGCCNMILWDVFLIFIFVAFGLELPIHMIFKITLGVGAMILFFLLLNIPIVGVIVQIIICLFWYEFFYEALPIESWTEGNLAALWFCRILLAFGILALHFASFYSLILNKDMTAFPPHVQRRNKVNDIPNNNSNTTYEYHFYGFGESKDQSSDSAESSHARYENDGTDKKEEAYVERNVSHPFYGCNDLESLKNRYRKLVRTYHPDENSGNAEAFEYIQSEYERLLKNFS